jgi:hypothetical protein
MATWRVSVAVYRVVEQAVVEVDVGEGVGGGLLTEAVVERMAREVAFKKAVAGDVTFEKRTGAPFVVMVMAVE